MIEIDRDLRVDKQINKHLLDEEAEMQPYVYGEWAKLAVDAKEEADRAKLTVDKVKAERFIFHKTPDKPDGKAATDKMAEHLVNSDPEVIAVQKAYIAANKVWGICKVAEESMQQKRSMIKVLTELNTTKYFIKEEVGSDIRKNKVKSKDAAVTAVEESVSNMNKKRKKKKKPPEPVIVENEIEEEEDTEEEEEEEETIYQTEFDEEMDSPPDDEDETEDEALDVDMEEEDEETVTPPETKRTVKSKGTGSKLKAQKSKKRTVKEQAEINQVEGKRLQKEAAEKKKEKPKGKCPAGHGFGISFGLEPECDECEIDNACFKARPKN